MQSINQGKQKIWQAHVQAAANHANGVRGYCEEMGISKNTFYFWKAKLQGRRQPKQPKAKPNPFLPAVIREPVGESVTAERLPDPEWLAIFVSAVLGGCQ